MVENNRIENMEDEILSPVTFTSLRLRPKETKAVGFTAIGSSLYQLGRWMKPSAAFKTIFKLNQKGGFDCPGCAWPDPDDDRSSLGEYCENGIKAIAEEATRKLLTADFFKKHSIEEIAQFSDYENGKRGRLTDPVVLTPGSMHYQPITWEAAFDLIANQLKAPASPNEAVFYTSGKTSNEAAFIYQLFVRAYGTNNLPDCSNMCHESSSFALSETVGLGKGSVMLEDFYKSDLVIIMGQNPGTNHPRMLNALEKCKQNGGMILAINPLPEAGLMHYINPQKPSKLTTGGIKLADLFLPVRINGDVALLKALMRLMWEAEKSAPGTVFDQNFIKEHTSGFEDFQAALEQIDFNECVRESGVGESLVREAARLIIEKENVIICWAMGITQHKNSVDNIREIVNLLLLKGSVGKPGAGICPVRGHSNVQGDRTVGIWDSLSKELSDALQKTYHFTPPQDRGFDTVNAIKAMHEGRAKVFFGLGGNFLSATPDTEYTAAALRNCDLTVHVSTKLNRSHLVHGKTALILPCLGRTDIDRQAGGEQFVSCENSMGVIQSSRGVLPPCSPNLKSEVNIIGSLAKATLGDSKNIDWEGMTQNYDLIREGIEKVIPGFEHYNERVRRPGGFYLPNPVRERNFKTKSGKAEFSVVPLTKLSLAPGEYIMMTIRSHDQFNTTIYGMNDRYRGVFNERRVVFMNEQDMEKAGLKLKQVVDIQSLYNGQIRKAHHFMAIPYDIPAGCLATYYPETNVLYPIDSVADHSNTPTTKSIVVTLQPAPVNIVSN